MSIIVTCYRIDKICWYLRCYKWWILYVLTIAAMFKCPPSVRRYFQLNSSFNRGFWHMFCIIIGILVLVFWFYRKYYSTISDIASNEFFHFHQNTKKHFCKQNEWLIYVVIFVKCDLAIYHSYAPDVKNDNKCFIYQYWKLI